MRTSRRRDVAEVVDCLAAYQPTHVAVELVVTDQEVVDAHYRQFLDGRWDLPPNERYQVGFWGGSGHEATAGACDRFQE